MLSEQRLSHFPPFHSRGFSSLILADRFKVKSSKTPQRSRLLIISPSHASPSRCQRTLVSYPVEPGWRCWTPSLPRPQAPRPWHFSTSLPKDCVVGLGLVRLCLDPPPLISFTFDCSPWALWLLSSNLLHKLTLLSILQTRASTECINLLILVLRHTRFKKI